MTPTKPETHYKPFLIILSVVSVLVTIVGLICYYQGLYNQDAQTEKTTIYNFNCDQLWNEEHKYILTSDDNAYNGKYMTVREQYHDYCLSKLFLSPWPTESQQDAYFLSLSCSDMQDFIKSQKPYYERAEIDFKQVCQK